MKKYCLVFISFICFSNSFSQYSLGAQLGFQQTLRQTGLTNIGLGIKGHYTFYNDHSVLVGGVNYFLPSSYNAPTYVDAIDSNITSPSQQLIDVDYKLSYWHITVGTELYFLGSYIDNFGLYGLLDVGLLIAPVTITLADYDHSLYTTIYPDVRKGTLLNPTIGIGLGFEKKLGPVHLFVRSKWNLTIKYHTDKYQDLPASIAVNAGLRFPLTGWF